VVWDSTTGEPLYNAIVWNDTRTAELVQQLCQQHQTTNQSPTDEQQQQYKDSSYFLQRYCGLPVSTYFSALKLKWLIENVDRVKEAVSNNRCMFGTIDSWLIWNMTGGIHGGKHVTDVTNASRTMLMNIHNLQWDDHLKSIFNIKNGVILPEIKSSAEVYGHFTLDDKNKIPIAGCVGDQQGALIGQRCYQSGEAKNTYGTGCFVLMNTGDKPIFSSHGLLTTVGYQLGKDESAVYALEGSVAVAGSGVKWLKDNMGIISSLEESAQLASSVDNTGGVYFVPAFSGLFAPYWRSDARGTLVGMTNYTTRAHICRAMLEAVSHQTQEVLEAMQKDYTHTPLQLLKVDGGMSNNDVVMQSQADLLGVPIIRPHYIETTAIGAAICAALGSGVYSSTEQIPQMKQEETTVFKSEITEEERSRELARWDLAVSKSLDSHFL
jgi:glycerol kinase